jgi:hypothetical protein
MAGSQKFRILARQVDHVGIGPGPTYQAFAGSFAKGQTEFDAGHGGNQNLMEVLGRHNEMCLPEDKVGRVRLWQFALR